MYGLNALCIPFLFFPVSQLQKHSLFSLHECLFLSDLHPTEKREFQAMTLEPCHVSTARCVHKAVVKSYCLIFRLCLHCNLGELLCRLRLVEHFGNNSSPSNFVQFREYIRTDRTSLSWIAIMTHSAITPLRSVMFTYRYEQRLRESLGTIILSSFLAICC